MTGTGIPRGRWSDLGSRVVSAGVMLVCAVLLGIATGIWLRLGVGLVAAGMMWELARLTSWAHPEFHGIWSRPLRPLAVAALGFVVIFLALSADPKWAWALLALPMLAGLPGARADLRLAYALYALAIPVATCGLVIMREGIGLAFVAWMVGCVVASDIAGYFVGKTLRGPKFWPRISPSKTWSGTIGGWVAGILLGAVLTMTGSADWPLIVISPLVVFAGQMGDIAESWLKRRAGVKDSSNLIPGHGGLLDRLDALMGAVLAAMLTGALFSLPAVG